MAAILKHSRNGGHKLHLPKLSLQLFLAQRHSQKIFSFFAANSLRTILMNLNRFQLETIQRAIKSQLEEEIFNPFHSAVFAVVKLIY
jgi:hypothetical protein